MPMKPWLRVVPLIVGLAVAAGCGQEQEVGPPPATDEESFESPAPIGGRVPDFTLTDDRGGSFKLSALDADRTTIERAIREAGVEYGLTADMDLHTKWADVPGLIDEGEFDPWAKWKLLAKAGGAFGRVATEESLSSVLTLGDAVDWIERLNGAPVVLMTWSPRCKTCPQQNEQVHEALAAIDARVFAVASYFGDTLEMFAKYRELYDFELRILPDPDQSITDQIGAERTPTFLVFDTDRTLRYRGALDDDPMGLEDLADRKGYVALAVEAIVNGNAVDESENIPPG